MSLLRFLTTLLFATNPFTVGFTHGTVPINGCIFVQSAGAAAPVATASARKNVPAANFVVNFPLAADAHALP